MSFSDNSIDYLRLEDFISVSIFVDEQVYLAGIDFLVIIIRLEGAGVVNLCLPPCLWIFPFRMACCHSSKTSIFHFSLINPFDCNGFHDNEIDYVLRRG